LSVDAVDAHSRWANDIKETQGFAPNYPITGDTDLARELVAPLRTVVDAHLAGTRYGIRVDPADGLLTQGASGVALTWMDARVDAIKVATWWMTSAHVWAASDQGEGQSRVVLAAWGKSSGTGERESTKRRHALYYRDLLKAAPALATASLTELVYHGALLDPEIREGYRRRGSDPEQMIDRCIELDNAIIGDHPGVTFGLHICRGNNRSKFYAEGDYEPIARIFKGTRFQRFLLEYDDERSGGFAPLRHVPDDRVVVLGLVTSKTGTLESKDAIKRRIDEAAKFVPLDQLCLSPQCGFASSEEGNILAEEEQWAKLRMIVELAGEIWGS